MKKRLLSLVMSLCVLLVCTILLQTSLLDHRNSERAQVPGCPWCDDKTRTEDVVYLPVSTSVIRLFSPADPHFIADLVWMRTAYYFGKHALTDRQYPYLLNLLDVITDLSPRWEKPYLFGAVAIPAETENYSDGFYIIDKGLAHHPDSWELWFFKGYYLWKSGNSADAAQAVHKASVCRGAPIYLANLSATFATRAGEKELAIRFLEEALKNIQDPVQRKIILKKMQEVMKRDDKHGS
jgi:tetratricopeptide (TPR) repeat protein